MKKPILILSTSLLVFFALVVTTHGAAIEIDQPIYSNPSACSGSYSLQYLDENIVASTTLMGTIETVNVRIKACENITSQNIQLALGSDTLTYADTASEIVTLAKDATLEIAFSFDYVIPAGKETEKWYIKIYPGSNVKVLGATTDAWVYGGVSSEASDFASTTLSDWYFYTTGNGAIYTNGSTPTSSATGTINITNPQEGQSVFEFDFFDTTYTVDTVQQYNILILSATSSAELSPTSTIAKGALTRVFEISTGTKSINVAKTFTMCTSEIDCDIAVGATWYSKAYLYDEDMYLVDASDVREYQVKYNFKNVNEPGDLPTKQEDYNLWERIIRFIVVPHDISLNYFKNTYTNIKGKFPFVLFYQYTTAIENAITNAEANTQNYDLAITLPPFGKINLLTSTTLEMALGSSTKAKIFDAIETTLWIGAGITAIAIIAL